MKLTVLDNSNIAESYPGITLPLTYSFVKRAYSGVFKGVIGSKLKNEAALDEFKNIFSNMVASYQGRVYYNINNWYSLIYFLPFPKMIAPVWQDMMGVQNKEIYLEKLRPFSPWRKARLYINLIVSFFRVPKDMNRLANDFESIKAYFKENYSESLSIKELWELYHEIENKALNKWYVTLHNDMYAFLWTGILKRRLSRKGADVTKYISGITSLESLKPLRALLAVAEKYGDEPDLTLNAEVRAYLEEYGDRSPCELKLEVMTYRENPSLLESQIRAYASDRVKLKEMVASLQPEAPLYKTGFAAKRARIGIENREISRLNRSRLYGMVRRIFIRIGEILQTEGRIYDRLDVFYLDMEEIENYEASDKDFMKLWDCATDLPLMYCAVIKDC